MVCRSAWHSVLSLLNNPAVRALTDLACCRPVDARARPRAATMMASDVRDTTAGTGVRLGLRLRLGVRLRLGIWLGSGSGSGITVDTGVDERRPRRAGGRRPVHGIRPGPGRQLITDTKVFTDAVRAGDVEAAKAAFAPSRQAWERIEPIAGLVSDHRRRRRRPGRRLRERGRPGVDRLAQARVPALGDRRHQRGRPAGRPARRRPGVAAGGRRRPRDPAGGRADRVRPS